MTDLTDIAARYQAGITAVTEAFTAMATLAGQQPTTPTPTPAPAPDGRPFTDARWLNDKIPAGAKHDPNSSAVIAELLRGQTKITNDTYGVTVYQAKPGDQRIAVKFSQNWGSNPHAGKRMPIPAAGLAVPPGGWGAKDGHVVVIDTNGDVFSEWGANDRARSAQWGSVVPWTGTGIEPEPMTSTGAALSRLAGIVLAPEMAAGLIPHALFISCKVIGAGFRYPARKSDQKGGAATQEGMRIQLDPTFDVSTLKSRAAQVLGKAMQDYGVYVGDGGGSGATFIGERTTAGGWPGVPDQMLLDIPWSRCWVLDESVTRP